MSSAVDDAFARAYEFHRAGNLTEAERRYREILAQAPARADAWYLLGTACLQGGRPAEAVEAILRAISLDRSIADYYNHLGAAYGQLGQHDRAVASLRHAVRLATQSAVVHYNLGTALREAGQLEEAVASFRHAIAAGETPEAHYNLANTLRELKRHDEAIASYHDALRLRPQYTKALINLGNVLTDRSRHDEAIETLRTAVAQSPNHANARLTLGGALRSARRFEEAEQVLRAAVALDPLAAEAHNNLGTVLQSLGQIDAAWACYRKAIELKPDLPDAHFGNGVLLLQSGDLERGFAEYEWRWKCKSFSNRRFEQPRWDGGPLEGRTILLCAEQGLGDTLHFIRYAADVKRAGGTVVFHCQPAAMNIVAGVAGIDQLVSTNDPPPRFDVYAPLMSLPGVLGLKIDNLSRGAYLTAQPKRVAAWRERLAELRGLRVGICWQGNTHHLFDLQRSVSLDRFAPISRIERIQLVSLQKGYGSEQLADCGFEVLDLGETLDADGPFLDTAAIIKNLDLVISSDTAVAHLAGALERRSGVPVAAHGDWRWFTERSDSPWYPTLRLFRQQQLNVWDDVFERIAAEVAALAAARS